MVEKTNYSSGESVFRLLLTFVASCAHAGGGGSRRSASSSELRSVPSSLRILAY